MRNFIESNTDSCTAVVQLCDWLRPFANCASCLKQGLIWDSLAVAIVCLSHKCSSNFISFCLFSARDKSLIKHYKSKT